jgi:hypothetical protein
LARRLSSGTPVWKLSELPSIPDGIPENERSTLRYPAKQFVTDLDAIIDAKPSVTRRQWLSLLDSVLRIGSVSHVLWLCRVNERLWKVLLSILRQDEVAVPTGETEIREFILSSDSSYLSYGNAAMPAIRDYASGYLLARLGVNLILWSLDELGAKTPPLTSVTRIMSLIESVKTNRELLLGSGVLNALYKLQDDEAKTVACKKGIGSNMVEFARHALGQRETANEALRGYDQSYFLKRRGEARNSPWVLSVGPVAVLALAHCCLREVSGPRSVRRLVDHLGAYGIEVDVDDINSSDLGKSLRMLGLVLDSPDAESGMLLVPPFGTAVEKAAQ